MNPVKYAVDTVGGRSAAAGICNRTAVSIHKWIKKGCLPRTEYTGKTHYAELLAAESKGAFTADWLLSAANPDKAS